jgi:hypothetical protein
MSMGSMHHLYHLYLLLRHLLLHLRHLLLHANNKRNSDIASDLESSGSEVSSTNSSDQSLRMPSAASEEVACELELELDEKSPVVAEWISARAVPVCSNRPSSALESRSSSVSLYQ